MTLHGLKHEHMEIDPEISSANGKHVQVLVAAGLYVLKSLIKIHMIFLTKEKNRRLILAIMLQGS